MILLHGDNRVVSRSELTKFVSEAKEKDREIIRLDGLVVSLTDIIQAFESPSFFAKEKLIVIENFFSRQKSKEKEQILDYFLKFFEKDCPFLDERTVLKEVVFWEGKEISPATVKKLKGWQLKKFKTPPVIFKFLDSFRPENKRELLFLLKSSIKNTSTEFIFYMLVRRLSQLILAKELGKEGLKGLAPWQQGRLVSQAKKFTLEQLTSIYQRLLKIDTDIKTGQTLMDFSWHLDLLVVGL